MEKVKNGANKEKLIEVVGLLHEKIGRITKDLYIAQEVGVATVEFLDKDVRLRITGDGCPVVINGCESFILDWYDILHLANIAGLFDDEEGTEP